MSEYVFNDKSFIEKILDVDEIDQKRIVLTMSCRARYNHFVRCLSPEDSYNDINQFMQTHCKIYSEVQYFKILKQCIKHASQHQWRNIDPVIITRAELDVIQSLGDIRKEKIAFVLLADAKYHRAWKNHSYTSTFLSSSNLFKMARVAMPKQERNIFLGFLIDEGLVEENLNPKLTNKNLTYINDDSEPVLTLNEVDYADLAYVYLGYKYPSMYSHCPDCGKWIKKYKNTTYCKECAPAHDHNLPPQEIKTVICVDCQREFTVNSKAARTIRCPECNDIYQKRRNADKNFDYRARKKS